MAKAKRGAERPGRKRSRVPRMQLLEEIDEGLAREGVVVLKAPWGYGKTSALRDYAQRAHDVSVRQVVFVDYSSPEVMGYLDGNDGELERLLSTSSRKERGSASAPAEMGAAQAGKDQQDDGLAPLRLARRKDRLHCRAADDVPPRYAGRASRAAWLHLRWLAGDWCRRLEETAPADEECPAPLLILDDIPELDGVSMHDLCSALGFWAARGAGIVLSCVPNRILDPALMRRALVLGQEFLSVNVEELAMWRRWLSIAPDLELRNLTNGVPMLVNACARVRCGDALQDKSYLHSCELVVSHALAEPLPRALGGARRAMVILGTGRLADLEAVGACRPTDEGVRRALEDFAADFPLFNIDFARGRFRCPPVLPFAGYSCVRMCVEDDSALAASCIELLLSRGDASRAAAVLCLLPVEDRAPLIEGHPGALADVLDGDAAVVSLQAAQTRCEQPGPGLRAFADFLSLCEDGPVSRGAVGFVSDIACVLEFWHRFAGFSGEGAPDADEASRAGNARADLIYELGEAGLVGDGQRVSRALDQLDAQLVRRRRMGDLPEAVVRCHGVACAVLAGRASQARAWVAPHAQRLSARRSQPRVPCGIGDALLSAALVLAGYAEELPSSGSLVGSGLETVRASRRYLEERRVGFGVAFCAAVEALWLVGMGDEGRADMLLDEQLRRWSAVGSYLGQAYARLGKAQCALAQNRPNQGRTHASLALGIAQRLRYPRLESTARLLLVVSLLRSHDQFEIGALELETFSRLAAQRGSGDAALVLTGAVLQSFQGEAELAGDALAGLVAQAGPADLRLGGLVVRALGTDKAPFLECLPDGLIREHNAIRDARRCGSHGRPDQDESWVGGARPVPGRCLCINVFGSMGGRLNGMNLGERGWGRSKGLTLACVLALAPQGRMSRPELAQMLFSSTESDCRRHASALSTTLSCLRDALGQSCGGPEYIVGSMGSLGLNPALVDTDVSHFENAARKLLARQDEMTLRETVEACDEVVRLFGLGPDPRLADVAKPVAKRVEQLCDLFADCMLVGADTSYARGEFDMSLGYAKHAGMVCPERADVAYAHDLALRAKMRKEDPVLAARHMRAQLESLAPC